MKPFRFVILLYADHVHGVHDLDKYLPSPPMKGESYEAANWDVRDIGFSENDICVAIKDGISSSIPD